MTGMGHLQRGAWIAVLSFGFGCGTTVTAKRPLDKDADPSEKSAVSDFVLKDIDGETHALSDYLGNKVVLLSFFAMWCEPCKKEMNHLAALFNALSKNGLMVLAISMDEPETQGAVRPFIKRRGFTFPVLLDTEARVTDRLNPRREAPFNLIIDRNGVITWTKIGYVEGDEKILEKAVASALGLEKE